MEYEGSLNIHKNALPILIFSQINLHQNLKNDFFSFHLNIYLPICVYAFQIICFFFINIRQNLAGMIFSPIHEKRLVHCICLHFISLILFW